MSAGQPLGRNGIAEAIGLRVEEISAERARASLAVTDAVRQPYGMVHGGVYSVIAESICSEATARAVAADGKIALGQSNSATFMRPVFDGTVHAVAERRQAGRTTWIWDVELTDDDGRIVALVRMTIAVRPDPRTAT